MTSTTPQTLPVPLSGLVKYISEHPDTPMANMLEPYREHEAHLRQEFAQNPGNDLLKDPHVNVLPLFTEYTEKVRIRARNLDLESKEEKSKYIMPLSADVRRPDGSPAIVQSLKEFQHNFSVFSESSLAELDWSNVVAAGSSVVNTLLPVPDEYNGSKRGLRQFYHEKFCPASDVDLFLYGLTEEQAIKKIKEIETRVRDVLLTETTVVRTKHAVTICSQYPNRHIQIVLRIYKSISEILTGFDVDCSGAAYDGHQVYCTPRALQAYMTQINHIDLSRRSPSYENRLSKYSHRGFEAYWPELDRSRIDPTIFERSFQWTLGLARLLVLETLPTAGARDLYRAKRREERGRPLDTRAHHQLGSLAGDLKVEYEDEVPDWLPEKEEDVSNYHTFSLPYGPRIHAKRIEKLCYTRDLLLNAEWNQPDGREVYLHRHPAFFGRVEDVVEDCCGFCPIPQTDEELEVAEEEAKIYVSGRISFLKDDPGRQQIGSFNPLTDDDWTRMAYVGDTARLCQAIVDGDLEHVTKWLAQENADPNTRDHTGRTPLHLAAMSSTPEIVSALVNAGARLVSRIADGRTALHLAAARGHVEIVKILLDKSAANEAEYEEKKDQSRRGKKEPRENADSQKSDVVESDVVESDGEESDGEESDGEDSEGELVDDVASDEGTPTMATGSFVKLRGKVDIAGDGGDVITTENEDEPDFYDINVVSWDTSCSALHLAILEGHVEVVKMLVQEYGADVLLPAKLPRINYQPARALLTLMLSLALPVAKAKEMVKLLLSLGATSAQADATGLTAFHHFVEHNAESLHEILWENDAIGAKTVVNHVWFRDAWFCQTPLQTAILKGYLAVVQTLLDHGAAPHVDFEAWLKSAKQAPVMENRLRSLEENEDQYYRVLQQTLITALTSRPRAVLKLLQAGADPNVITNESWQKMRPNSTGRFVGQSALDVANSQLRLLRQYEPGSDSAQRPVLQEGMETFLSTFESGTYQHWLVAKNIDGIRKSYEENLKTFLENEASPTRNPGVREKEAAIHGAVKVMEDVREALLAKGAKSFAELYPQFKDRQDRQDSHRNQTGRFHPAVVNDKARPYTYTFSFRDVTDLTQARHQAYMRLFNAAWQGDLETIRLLTLTSWDDAKEEAPLKIAAQDQSFNNPFSLAFSRGHYSVAKAVLEIAHAQYVPKEKPKTRYRLHEASTHCGAAGEDSDAESTASCDSESGIFGEIVDEQFTIENIGEISMKVNSQTKPLELLGWGFTLNTVIAENDMKGLKFLLEVGESWSKRDLASDAQAPCLFSFPDHAFGEAIKLGRVEMLREIIQHTGAGLPLEHLVKNTGVKLKMKPRFYQGLTVYGKKRDDWASAGRDVVHCPESGSTVSPLLRSALCAQIESIEWFLSDAPLRHYLTFANSEAVRDNVMLKHLAQAPGGFEGSISRWLNDQSELLLLAALEAPPGDRVTELVSYLIKTQPGLLNVRAANGVTPLMLAYRQTRHDIAKLLIDAGADQTIKDSARNNLLHALLYCTPDVKELKPLLDLLDRDTLVQMLKGRNKLALAGRTPLHQYCRDVATSGSRAANNAIRVIKLLTEVCPDTAKQVLRMLDGAGDTPLHILLANDAETTIVHAIIDFDPSLLCCENAVGRTPAEVAHDRYLIKFFTSPQNFGQQYWHSTNSVASWLRSRPYDFVKQKTCQEASEHEANTTVARNWRLCAGVMARIGQPKRTLVSLNSANLVAKRLGEKYLGNRYQFRVGGDGGGDAAASSSAQDGDSSDDNGVAAPVKTLGAREKTKRRETDIITETMERNVHTGWWNRHDDREETDEDDDMFPYCSKCEHRHYRGRT